MKKQRMLDQLEAQYNKMKQAIENDEVASDDFVSTSEKFKFDNGQKAELLELKIRSIK